jgi:hypothetical protein
MDKMPREMTADQQEALLLLARLVMTQLELRRHSKELVKARVGRDRMSAELEKVRAKLVAARRELAKHRAKLRRSPPQAPPKKRT